MKEKTFKEWKEELLPTEISALEDMYANDTDYMTPNEVFQMILEYEGYGAGAAYHVRSIVSRVYGIKLE